MKKTVLLLFVGLLAFGVQAQEKTAKIEFKTETIDYGEIEKGRDGVRVFEFKNTGDAPLVISDVKSSCGCTIPKKPENRSDVRLLLDPRNLKTALCGLKLAESLR